MKIEHLEHKHGGRITSIHAIEHETYKRLAQWEYRGSVTWEDGTVSPSAHIAPTLLCFDHNTQTACDEFMALSKKLEDYLDAQGEWKETKRGATWIPKIKKFSLAI